MSDQRAASASGPGPDELGVVVEKAFEVGGTPAAAWEKLVGLTAARNLGPNDWWVPGFECRATEVTAVAGRRLEVTKAEPPCAGSTIVFTFDACDDGTRIHVSQSDFDPAFVEMAGEDFWSHGTLLLDAVERFFAGPNDTPA